MYPEKHSRDASTQRTRPPAPKLCLECRTCQETIIEIWPTGELVTP